MTTEFLRGYHKKSPYFSYLFTVLQKKYTWGRPKIFVDDQILIISRPLTTRNVGEFS